MNFIDKILSRNADYAAKDFSADLKIIPSQRTLILGCVDPRVDPADVLQLRAGETAIIRNVGGRVNPALLDILTILRTVSKAGGDEIGRGWNLVLLHHTDCGIKGCLRHAPELLGKIMGTPVENLSSLAIDDPYAAVKLDIAALKKNPDMPADLTVTGMVYDVKTGKIDIVAAPEPLRAA